MILRTEPYEIWGFQSGEDPYCGLLNYDRLQSYMLSYCWCQVNMKERMKNRNLHQGGYLAAP
jgi:hypothetical protein